MSAVVFFIILAMIVSMMEAVVDRRIQVAASVTRHTKRTTKVGIGPLSLILYPAFQTGDKGRIQVGDIANVGPGTSPQIELTSPRDGMAFNMLMMRHSGTVTAVAGGAAGNGAHDQINSFDVECEHGQDIVKNLRWKAAWLIGYSMDSFVPIAAVTAGAGGGVFRSTIFLPTFITQKTGRVKITVRGEATLAFFHTTATTFTGTVRVYVDMIPQGTAKNKKRIAYREEVVDVILANAQTQFDPEVVGEYLIFRSIVFTQDTARGTMADDIATLDFLLRGENVIRSNMVWADFQEQFRLDFRRTAAVAGVGIGDWKPKHNTAADQFTLRNGAVATVATSGVVFAYLEP